MMPQASCFLEAVTELEHFAWCPQQKDFAFGAFWYPHVSCRSGPKRRHDCEDIACHYGFMH